ncbi:MAG TPA: hypothetical protein VGT02_15825 [Methylomirabilota bacterium]|jgi:hypothetical protein|nr:hypothetical protein [Methylomirabilota bacterium]
MALLTPTTWRLPHWLIAGSFAVFFSVYSGLVQPREIVLWFAARPEVSQAFADPHFGRADALILVFSTLFLAPFALFVGMVLLIFAVAMLGGFVLPVVRWFSMPDWMATALVIAVVSITAWAQSELWLPRSLWFIGLLARAWKIILT